MKVFVIAVLATLALQVAAQSGQCLDSCTVNADCTGTTCQFCMGGVCGSGCSQTCQIDQDCRDLNCRYCYQGVCGNSPYHTCGQSCQVPSDCDQNSDCATCAAVNGSNVCTAGCGAQCIDNSECLVSGCTNCILGTCSHDNGACGSACAVNTDCNQATMCNLCLAGKCGAGCSQPCTEGSQCLDTGCNFCGSGVCRSSQPNVPCHGSCTTDSQCTGSPGTCEQCFQHKCASTCGKMCKQATDCVVNHCGNCFNNTCIAS